MTPEYHVTHLKLLIRAKEDSAISFRNRPYGLIVQQSDGVLNHFATGNGMQPLKEDK